MNNLYATLYQSIYTLHGLDREFVLDLTKKIPFVPGLYWRETDTLAVIPSRRVKTLRRAARESARRIRRNRRYFAHFKGKGRIFSLDLLRELQGDHDEIMRALAEG